ncbi:MAG TPA: antibiotic biosynthesis monooxygenase [Pseudonocardia sp.]|nr:antibiotic biosynthesis monooxygenase [Pseudonocardia sp.]
MAVIVAGRIYVDPADRDRYVEGHQEIVERARAYPGCLDLAISADAVEPGRVNIFEHFESAEALEAFRAGAPTPSVSIDMLDAQVLKHQISSSGPPFG